MVERKEKRMTQEEFLRLYSNYKPTDRTKIFNRTGYSWDDRINKWVEYRDIIKNGGLPIDRWLKNTTDGYLPDFLEREKNFGHARPAGSMQNNMIYQDTATLKKGKPNPNYQKYYDVYKGRRYFDAISDVEDDYNAYIKPLLTTIVEAENIYAVFEVERSENYTKYISKQILKKISILMSLTQDSAYPNAFLWIYDDEVIAKLADLLGVDYDDSKTFLENNHLVYEKAKTFAKINAASTHDDYIKLFDFLWFLTGSSFNTTELSDFRCINLIFNGAPGTGKTFGVTKGIEKLHALDGNKYKDSRYIQFHPSFTYQDFIEGIKPLGIKDGNLDLQAVNGSFKDFCILVKKKNEEYYKGLSKKPKPENPSDFADWPHYYFVVDEINRGNLSNIFGETFTLLEPDYRDYDFSGKYTQKPANLISTALSSVIANIQDPDVRDSLTYKKIENEICFGIPFNIHFIGIMNDVDKSIDAFDLALRRRFKWIPKYCNYDVIQENLVAEGYAEDNVSDYVESCKSLNEMICDTKSDGLKLGRTYEIGHSFFLKIKNTGGNRKITKSKKAEVFDAYISGTIKEYIRQVADEGEVEAWIEKAKAAFGL